MSRVRANRKNTFGIFSWAHARSCACACSRVRVNKKYTYGVFSWARARLCARRPPRVTPDPLPALCLTRCVARRVLRLPWYLLRSSQRPRLPWYLLPALRLTRSISDRRRARSARSVTPSGRIRARSDAEPDHKTDVISFLSSLPAVRLSLTHLYRLPACHACI